MLECLPICLSVCLSETNLPTAQPSSGKLLTITSKCSCNLQWVHFYFCPRALQKEEPQTIAKSARYPTAWPPPRGIVLWWRNTWYFCHSTDCRVRAFPCVGTPAQHDKDTVPVGARAHKCRRRKCKAGKGHPRPKMQAARGIHTALQAWAHPQDDTWRCCACQSTQGCDLCTPIWSKWEDLCLPATHRHTDTRAHTCTRLYPHMNAEGTALALASVPLAYSQESWCWRRKGFSHLGRQS